MTEFLALVSGSQRVSSVAGICDYLEIIVLHDMLSPTPEVVKGTPSLLGRRQDDVSGKHVALAVGSPGRRQFLKCDAVYLSP